MDFFIHPERLWHLVWLVPAIITLGIFAQLRRRRALKTLLGAAHFSGSGSVPVGVNASPEKRFFRVVLLVFTAILLTATWARPSWGEKIHPFTGAGRDIVIALDLSKSMLSEDVKPSRLAHAKRFADDLSDLLPGDRFGLVSFAGTAFLSCPLTFDRVSFRAILDGQTVGSVPVGGTNLESALKTAANAFETAENLGHCAIVLISDGGELTGSLAREAEKLRAAKLPVVVVGIGDPAVAAPIPLPTENGRTEYLKDRSGNIVNTRLEERPLAELASKTGGVYLRSTTTQMGDRLAAEWLKELTPGAQKENVHAVPIERREWFLVPALLVFLLYLALGESVSKTKGLRAAAFEILLRTPKIIAFFALVAFAVGAPKINAEPENVESDAPAEISATELYNRGLEAQESGEITRSRELYRDALAQSQLSENLRSATTQNLGAGFHAEARNGTASAAATAQSNLDGALNEIQSTEENFKRAQTFYRDFLCSASPENAAGTTRNLQILLNDQKQLEALKKQIEELKKQMQQAAQQAQNAAQQQEKSNEQSEQSPQNSRAQKQAQSATSQAQQQAEQMKSAAEKLNNQSLANAAQEASKELQKAQEEQKSGNGEKAEAHLKKAAEILRNESEKNSETSREKEKSDSDQDKQNSESAENDKTQDSANSQNSEEDLSKNPEEASATQGEKPEDRELDQAATEAILRDMAKDEAQRRKAIQSEQNAQIRQVEKDW